MMDKFERIKIDGYRKGLIEGRTQILEKVKELEERNLRLFKDNIMLDQKQLELKEDIKKIRERLEINIGKLKGYIKTNWHHYQDNYNPFMREKRMNELFKLIDEELLSKLEDDEVENKEEYNRTFCGDGQ